jgi:hypothetical protein
MAIKYINIGPPKYTQIGIFGLVTNFENKPSGNLAARGT